MFWIVIGLLFILAVEVYADFFLQSRDVATKKSKDFSKLTEHIMIMVGAVGIAASIVLSFAWGNPIMGIMGGAAFAAINGFIHGIIDWNIWNVYKIFVSWRIQKEVNKEERKKYNGMLSADCPRLYAEAEQKFISEKKYAEDSAFYNTIGVDRYLHIATIIILYFWFL
jgi:hypothetical protein